MSRNFTFSAQHNTKEMDLQDDYFEEKVLDDWESSTMTLFLIYLSRTILSKLPRLNTVLTNDLSDVFIPGTLDDVYDKVRTDGGILCAHSLVHLLVTAQSSCQKARRNAPNFNPVFSQDPCPLPHHHIHAGFAGSVGCDTIRLLGPALCRRLVQYNRCIFTSSEGRSAACDEDDPRIR